MAQYLRSDLTSADQLVRSQTPFEIQKRLFVTVECGGSYPNHPQLPSQNILQDLRKNLISWHVEDQVKVIAKPAFEAYGPLSEILQSKKVDLLIIDADGNIGAHIFNLAPFLSDHCVIVLDDYNTAEKGPGVRSFVSAALDNGSVEQIALDGGSTWFGRILTSAAELPARPFLHEKDNCWISHTVVNCDSDNLKFPASSQVRLFENDVELGPAHSIHDDIRKSGRGRFSLWAGQLYFSASDNTNPNLNGRKYTARHESTITALN